MSTTNGVRSAAGDRGPSCPRIHSRVRGLSRKSDACITGGVRMGAYDRSRRSWSELPPHTYRRSFQSGVDGWAGRVGRMWDTGRFLSPLNQASVKTRKGTDASSVICAPPV